MMRYLILGLLLVVLVVGPTAAQPPQPMPTVREAMARFMARTTDLLATDLVSIESDKQLKLYLDDPGESVQWRVLPASFGTITPDPDIPTMATFSPLVDRGGGTVWAKADGHPWRVIAITVIDGWVRGHLHPGERIPK